MVSRSRVFAALTLAVMPVTSGLAASPSFAAEAVQAKGSCWTYVPQAVPEDATLLERLSAGVQRDGHGASTIGALDWTPNPDGAELTLSTSGGTAVNSTRTLELKLADGPVLDTAVDRKGEAHAVFLVVPPTGLVEGEEPHRVVASAEFDVKAGEQVGGLTFTTKDGVELKDSGEYSVSLQSVFFTATEDLGGVKNDLFWVCNAQSETQPTGSILDDPATTDVVEQAANPATTPVAWSEVYDTFVVQDVSTLTVDRVVGQRWSAAARAGDEVVLSATGLPSDSQVWAAFGPVGGPFVKAEPALSTDADGSITTPVTVTVPEDAPAGVGFLTFVDADGQAVGAQMNFVVVGAPTLAVTEKVGKEGIRLTVRGTGYDPYATVRMRSRAGEKASGDALVTAVVDPTGAFEATYEVTEEDATVLRAVQDRVDGRAQLVAVHEISSEFPGVTTAPPGGGTNEPGGTRNPSASGPTAGTPGATTPTVPSASTPAAVPPPVQIPIPAPAPLQQIPAPTVPESSEAQLEVTETRLEGSASVAELFGGTSRRQVAFEVENVGDAVATDPEVLLGVGRTADVQPGLVATTLGDLQPGGRVAVGVNVALPMASFGTYQVVGQVGEDAATAFTVRWDTYPWGLIGVNALGVGLLAWGVTRRRSAAAPLPTGPGAEEAGASVVDLSALDKWWKDGKVVHTAAPVEDDNDSLVDLDAADRWWSQNTGKVS